MFISFRLETLFMLFPFLKSNPSAEMDAIVTKISLRMKYGLP